MTAVALSTMSRLPDHPHLWRRSARATWLTHRSALLAVGIVFSALVAAIVVPALSIQGAYSHFIADGCLGHPYTGRCQQLLAVVGGPSTYLSNLAIALHLFPLIAGVFIGAPLIARELESNSFRFTWTQGIGRSRFELRRFVLLAGVTVVAAAALGLLMGWFAHPVEVVGLTSRWDAGLFDTTVLTLPAWTFFALAGGTLVGLAVKRTVNAMAITALPVGGLLLSGAIRQFGNFPGLVERVLRVAPAVARMDQLSGQPWNTPAQGTGLGPRGSWLVQSWVTTPRGHALNPTQLFTLVSRRPESVRSPGPWLASMHYKFWYSYQPAARFWTFEVVCAVALVALAVVITVVMLRLLRRHC